MVEENTTYDGQGLKGALWTIAGTSIAGVAQRLVGGVFGGGGGMNPTAPNCAAGNLVTELTAENARLKAEKYSDNAALAQSERLLTNYLKPYGDAIAANQVVIGELKSDINCLKKTQELELRLMQKDIELAKKEASCCCEKNAAAINTVASIVNGITKVVVPGSAVCPPVTTTTTSGSTTTTP